MRILKTYKCKKNNNFLSTLSTPYYYHYKSFFKNLKINNYNVDLKSSNLEF